MESITSIMVIILGLGAVFAAVLAIGMLIVGWWFIIPLAGLVIGGGFGLVFALGLDVVIWIVVAMITTIISSVKDHK